MRLQNGLKTGLSLGCGVKGNAINRAFQFTIRTTTASETMTIPCQNVGVFDAAINWGDGVTTTVTAYNDVGLSHVYATAGDYKITITGTFPNVWFINDAAMAAKVVSVENLGDVGWQTLNRSFAWGTGITAFNVGDAKGAISSLEYAFYYLSNAAQNYTLDLSPFTVAGGSSLYRTFYRHQNTGDIILPTLTGVTSLYQFAELCSAVSMNVENIDVSACTVFNSAFAYTSMPLNVSGWDTSSATSFANMFAYYNSGDVAIDGWNIGALTTAASMFIGRSIPTSRYDATLIAWEAQAPANAVTIDFGTSQYTLGGAAEAARNSLIGTYGWTITDGGGV